MGKSKLEERNRNGDRRPTRRTAQVADWGTIPADAIRSAISAAGVSGGALRFGYTRDGGAYAIGIYGLGDPYTEYVRPGDDVEGFLRDICQAFEELPGGHVTVYETQARLPGT